MFLEWLMGQFRTWKEILLAALLWLILWSLMVAWEAWRVRRRLRKAGAETITLDMLNPYRESMVRTPYSPDELRRVLKAHPRFKDESVAAVPEGVLMKVHHGLFGPGFHIAFRFIRYENGCYVYRLVIKPFESESRWWRGEAYEYEAELKRAVQTSECGKA